MSVSFCPQSGYKIMSEARAEPDYLFERRLTMEISHKTIWMIAGALIIAAFLIGFVPARLTTQSLNHRLQQQEKALVGQASEFQKQQAFSRDKLRLAELNNQLGMLMIMTQEKNFGEARERSTQFFDGLRQYTQDTQDNNVREKLMVILNRRDEITADLSLANAGVSDKLRSLYQDMFRISVA